ncbi:aerolysin-like protein [Polypterus senegalus]|nr:aerolysin-like protein [Polypterus senegalus]
MTLPVYIIGGSHSGVPFDFTGYNNGALLEKIGVWVGGWQVKSIKLWLTDGQTKVYGNADREPYSEFKFEPGEFFSSLSLWGNGAGTRLGAIKFRTNKQREFFAYMTSWGLKKEYVIDVGSGICLGVMGRSGSDIDSLGFMFIKSVRSAVMKDVEYPTLHQVVPSVNVEEIKSMTYKNKTSVEQEYTLQTSKTITKKSSWSVTNSMETSIGMSVKVGILDVVEIGTEFSFKLGIAITQELENTETRTETLTYNIKVPPGKTMDIHVTIGRANIDLPYNATVEITCLDGAIYQYKKSGVYKGLTYTEAKAVIEESNKQIELPEEGSIMIYENTS